LTILGEISWGKQRPDAPRLSILTEACLKHWQKSNKTTYDQTAFVDATIVINVETNLQNALPT